MLFSSPEFIFLFLPVAVALHFALARWSADAAIVGTTVSSLAFYAFWNPPWVVLPLASILVNYWIAARIVGLPEPGARRLLVVGIVANLAVLGYFKYADFLASIVDGRTPAPPDVPLALSFTTFVQIAFLVYVHQRRRSVDFRRYALFVAFFPHLIAGPIVRWDGLGRQLDDTSRFRFDWGNVALGVTIFTLGLAKKVLIADSLSPHVAAVFAAAAKAEPITGFAAWGACFGFATQIYFDFSGYSDMAVGLGLLFNYRLPVNFAAPLRAASMLDFWRRWHVTLSRLARDLVYVPLARGSGKLWRAIALVITMIVIGVWHGAGWTFVAWGAYNGVLLVINTLWRDWRGTKPGSAARLVGWAMTFTAFAAGMALFRAADIGTSARLLIAMAGMSDAPVPAYILLPWDNWGVMHGYISESFVLNWLGDTWSVVGTLATAVAILIALLVPDTMEIVDYRESDAQSNWRRSWVQWRPSPMWLGAVATTAVLGLIWISRVQEFLYYQF
jgi:alginate O-acetyltransferase complex protein AlgI